MTGVVRYFWSLNLPYSYVYLRRALAGVLCVVNVASYTIFASRYMIVFVSLLCIEPNRNQQVRA